MPSLKEFDTKLASLKNTQKMTKTMKMVSASKLRRAQDAQRHAVLYEQHLKELIGRLAASVEAVAHPLLTPRSSVKNVLMLVITSDRGLCGGFNNNLVKQVYNWVREKETAFENVYLSCCGRRGFMYFRTKVDVRTHYEEVTAKPDFVEAGKISTELAELFVNGEVDEVYMAYNLFKNALRQTPTIAKLLPIEPGEIERQEKGIALNYILEPAEPELLARLLPKSVNYKIYHALIENSAGEHGARMTAMDNATNNADSMIDIFTLKRNRARQAAITTELIEIVAGAEAL